MEMDEYDYFQINPHVEKHIIKKGVLRKKPSLGETCTFVLKNECEDKSETLEMTIGNGCSLKDRLIESCLQTMHNEEESSFRIKFEKENEIVRYIITLLTFREQEYIFLWTDEKKLESSNFYKAMGTELFKKGNTEEAFYKFSIAFKLTALLDSVLEFDEPKENLIILRTALYNNLASCQLHFKNYAHVIKLCSDSLKLHPTSKAFYRRALANIELKNYEKAEMDLIELLKIEPRNKAAVEKYKLVRELDKSNRENYESIVRKMFC